MNIQFFTRLKAASYLLGLLLSVVATSVLGQTTITFDDQGYAHDANLGKTITIGNFEFSVRDENLQEDASASDIYYESDLDANGFGGSGLIYVGDQFNTDDPVYFIVKTVDGTERDFQSLYIFDYIDPSIDFIVGLTAEAYRNGTLLGSQDLTIPESSKTTYTLDPVFNNVDEIRIRQQTPLKYPGYPGVLFAFDHFVIGSPSNDPPAVSGLPASIEIIEDTDGYLDIASSAFSDDDSDEITAILSVSEGVLILANTGGRPIVLGGHLTPRVTVTGAPDAINGYLNFPSNVTYRPPAGLSGSPAAILTVSANDGDGSGDVELGRVPINIAGANDAPLITTSGGSTTFSEPFSGSPVPVVIDNALTVADPDNGTLVSATVAITANFQSGQDVLGFANDGSTMGDISGNYDASLGTLTLNSGGATATLAEWQAALRAVTFRNNSLNPATANRTITFIASDGTAASPGATKTVVVRANDNIPVVSNLNGDNVTFTEAGPAILLDAGGNATVYDPDSHDLENGYVVVHIRTNAAAGEDKLAIRHEGMGAGQIGIAGGDLYYGGTHIGLITGAGTTSMTVNFLAAATPAAAQALIRNLIYLNSSTNPSTDPREIRVSLNDGEATLSSYNDVTVNVIAVTNGPVVTTSGGSTTFTESFDGGPAQAVLDNALTVTDPDNTGIVSATVSITGNFQSGEDVLSFTGDATTMGNIAGSYNAANGVLTLTSEGSTATVAEWQAALRAVTYGNGSPTPNTATRTVSFVVSNGSADSSPATKEVDVVAVNSKPVAMEDAVTTSEDLPTTGNVLTNDSDPEGNQVTASLVTAPVRGLVVLNADGSFTYTPDGNYNGMDKLQYQVCDNGSPSRCDTAWAYFTIEEINDAPEITAPATVTVDEDAAALLTGISFADVDAGSSSVTAKFLTTSGTLAATSDGAVIVGGSGTAALSLTGPVADLNAFVAAGKLTFTTALNAADDVTLTVEIDDGGHTGTDPGNSGTGSSEADATTVTLNVNAVNDAPVNAVPTVQSVDGDGSLVFSTGNSNLISVSDADAGGGIIKMTLTADHGLITLAGVTGLVFTEGDGTDDGTLIFEGAISDIKAALNGMTFRPTAGFSGPASLEITTDDLGLTGTGGAQTDTDIINITVNAVNPIITTVNADTPDGTYKVNDVIPITLTFNQVVSVNGGVPSLLLETGPTDRKAVYHSGSGSAKLTFNYTVQAGDLSADLDYGSVTALTLNGAAIQSGAGLDAVLTLPAVGSSGSIAGQHNIIVDGVAPAVSAVTVPANGYYRNGDALSFTVQLDEKVVVNTAAGTPYLELTIGTAAVRALYESGSGTEALRFRYTVLPGEQDLDGIELGSGIMLNGGTMQDPAGNNAVTALNNAAPTDNVFVYSLVPGVTLTTTAVSPVNAPFTVSIVFSEAVTGFDLADITAVNASVSDLKTADDITYTALVTPAADGAVSLSVPAGAAQNIADENNTASNTLNLTYDATAPAIPQGLAAEGRDATHVINWTANTEGDLAAYALYGAATANPTTLLARIDAPVTTYTHAGVTGGVTWHYRLAAIDEAGNESGLSEEVTALVKLGQEITFAPEATVTYGAADFNPGATSTNNSIDIVYSSSDDAVASIVAGRIHIRKAGTVTITARQEGDAVYNEAVPREQVLTIRKAPLTITAENKSRKYGEENPTFTFTYAGFVNGEDESQLSTPPSASTEATPLTPPGKYPIVADEAAAANYAPRYVNGVLTIVPSARSLTFAPLPEKTYGDADFDLSAEANTDETVIYSSSNTAVAEIVDGKIHIQGAGSAIITATLPENPNYENTPEISRELLVNKASQEIRFAEIGQVQRDAGTLQLDVSASSGLPVELEVSNELVATLTGPADLQVLRLGSAIITATQPGNANYLPAVSVERELVVVDQAGERVRVSKVVSPNSDGINDFLIIEGISDFPDNSLVIVNRNGISMFETSSYDNGSNVFHGKANTRVIGDNLPAGTYFYLLEYRSGSEIRRQKGWFVLRYQ